MKRPVFRSGDRVITPLGKCAIITSVRSDGRLDARYLNVSRGDYRPTILHPSHLRLDPTVRRER